MSLSAAAVVAGPVAVADASDRHVAPAVEPDHLCEITNGAAANVSSCLLLDPTQLSVGREGTAIHRGLLDFAGLLDAIDGHPLVLSARLRAQVVDQSAAATSNADLHQLTRGFRSGATWNRSDGRSSWSLPGGDYVSERQGRAAISPADVGEHVAWDATDFAQRVVDRTTTSSNLMLRAANEGLQQSDRFEDVELDVRYADRTGLSPLYAYDHFDLSDGSQLDVNLGNGNLVPDVGRPQLHPGRRAAFHDGALPQLSRAGGGLDNVRRRRPRRLRVDRARARPGRRLLRPPRRQRC